MLRSSKYLTSRGKPMNAMPLPWSSSRRKTRRWRQSPKRRSKRVNPNVLQPVHSTRRIIERIRLVLYRRRLIKAMGQAQSSYVEDLIYPFSQPRMAKESPALGTSSLSSFCLWYLACFCMNTRGSQRWVARSKCFIRLSMHSAPNLQLMAASWKRLYRKRG